MSLIHSASAINLHGRGLLVEGPPGSGKSSLVLALIDRGAVLIGDDGLTIEPRGDRLLASPPPNTAGLLEIRNVGLLHFPLARDVPVSLILRLDPEAPRFIDAAETATIAGIPLPLVRLWPGSPVLALRAEAAMRRWGLP